MNKRIVAFFVAVSLAVAPGASFAAENSAADILRQGLLGAGSGALGGLASGGKSENLWISALTGAGVNIVGGSLLDVIAEGSSKRKEYIPAQRRVYTQNAVAYDRQVSYQPVAQPVVVSAPATIPAIQGNYSPDYIAGFRDGYKEAYLLGYKEAVKDLTGK